MSSELSKSGQPIYRHEERTSDFQFASGNEENIERISSHVEKYIGKIDRVFHELVSDLIHLDVLAVHPSPTRNYYTFITCGMSDLPMTVPPGAEKLRFAELLLCVPSDWMISEQAFQQEEHYWPIHWLKKLARLPHEYNSWLYYAHTIPNGDPAQPFASNTRFSGMMLGLPTIASHAKEFFTLNMSDQKEVHFFSLIPLYTEEMEYKLQHGADSLFDKLGKAGVNEIVNVKRKNVCKKSFWLF